MTLPSSGSIAMSSVASELMISATGLSLNHSWVRALAGRPSGGIGMSDLFGQSGAASGSYTCALGNYGPIVVLPNNPFFGASLSSISYESSMLIVRLNGSCRWGGNIKVTNNTLGTSAILSWASSNGEWALATSSDTLLRVGYTDNFTIQPSN